MTTPAETKKQLAPWKQQLLIAEQKCLAITNPERVKIELGFAAQLLQNSADLQKCTPESIQNAVINVARTGVTLNPIMKFAHLVNRGGKCTLDIDYKGLIKIMIDNECCKNIIAIIVYDDEEFEESESPIQPHAHKRKHVDTEEEQAKRKIIGVYSRVLMMDNTVMYTEFMPYWHVLKVEKSSPAARSQYSPWKSWRESMIKKTKIRYDFKFLPPRNTSNEISAIIELEDQNNGAAKPIQSGKRGLADVFNIDEASFEEISDITTEDQLRELLSTKNTPEEVEELQKQIGANFPKEIFTDRIDQLKK